MNPLDNHTNDDARDLALARAAQAGDVAALGELAERHRAGIGRLLWRFARTRGDWEDLVQDTFLKMVGGIESWRAEQPFSHWLYRIATNVGRDYFRRNQRRRRHAVEWEAADEEGAARRDALLEGVDGSGDPAVRAAANDVKAVLAGLPADERTLLTLHHLEGWDHKLIARQFGWTVAATKIRAWRARRRLQALLEEQGIL